MTPAELFHHAYTVDPSGCWLRRNVRRYRYGRVIVDGRFVLAHRYSWELFNGRPIPDGKIVCHKCDTPACVNPHHLFLGTHADNVADKVAKNRGRCGSPKGIKNPKAKLTEAQVLEIRQSSESLKALSKRYGMLPTAIWRIRRRISWAHL